MVNIKRFFDKISHLEGKKVKDVVIPIAEARVLRDEIAKVLADLHAMKSKENSKEEVIKVEITGGKFK